MKTLTRIMLASALKLLIAAPAYAAYLEPAQQTLQAVTQNAVQNSVKESGSRLHAYRNATDSMAFEPAGAPVESSDRYFHDSGIGSQS